MATILRGEDSDTVIFMILNFFIEGTELWKQTASNIYEITLTWYFLILKLALNTHTHTFVFQDYIWQNEYLCSRVPSAWSKAAINLRRGRLRKGR